MLRHCASTAVLAQPAALDSEHADRGLAAIGYERKRTGGVAKPYGCREICDKDTPIHGHLAFSCVAGEPLCSNFKFFINHIASSLPTAKKDDGDREKRGLPIQGGHGSLEETKAGGNRLPQEEVENGQGRSNTLVRYQAGRGDTG